MTRRIGAAAAALVGLVLLAALFRGYWVGAGWQVAPATELVMKGRAVAAHFGLDVKEWKAYEVPTLSKPLARYGHGLSPLTVRITYVEKAGGRAAEVGFDSSGSPIYWRAPAGYKQAQKFDSDVAAATQVFQYIAGAEAPSYQSGGRSAGDGAHEENYVWKKKPEPHSEFRDQVTVLTKDTVVKSVERKRYLANDDDLENNYGLEYWDVLLGAFGLICTVAVVAAIGIYMLWLARKAINHQFPLRMAIAGFLLQCAGMAGIDWAKTKSVNLDFGLPIFSALMVAVLINCLVAVGRGISEKTRGKWITLEELCRLAPLSRWAGESLMAGVLFAPLLAAIPFAMAACGLFPHSLVLPANAEVLYSRAPLMDSLGMQANVYLLGFFGFGLPAAERLARHRWLRWLMVLAVGTLFTLPSSMLLLVDGQRASGPLAGPVAESLLTLAILWTLWSRFDVLAVLTAQLTSGLVLSLLMLTSKGESGWSVAGGIALLIAGAVWCYARGTAVAEGDPRASIPALTGFRAEREKLRAEFSVARRAQQDMLPRTPPTIPGYSIAATCIPSLEVGGDLYDFLKLPDGRVGIGVADVSGKGVPAALYMTLTKGLLASIAKENSELGPVVEEVNRHLHGVTRKKVFVTMALGFLNGEKRVLECVRAGHNPMVWRQRSQDSTTLVSPNGLGLGITASRVFSRQLEVRQMQLSEGDAVVFYSDGITEAMNSELEQFGEQRLMTAVEKTDEMDATAARDSILSDVREFLAGVHPQDDMTLVVLRVGV